MEHYGDRPASLGDQAKLQAERTNEAVARAADNARDAITHVSDQATGAYARIAADLEIVGEACDLFVRNAPYLATVLAAGAGVLLGLLLTAHKPKTVSLTL